MRDFQIPGRSTVHAANGVCATSHPVAALIAVEALRDGGSAVDAAVAAAMALGLLEPAMTGIGGDAFALVWKPGDARPLGYNGSGRAPAGADAERLRATGARAIGIGDVEAVTLPGAVDLLDTLLSAHGRLGWERAAAPAIRIAEEGHPVAPRAAYDWAQAEGSLQGDARRHFLLPGERAPKAGEKIAYPAQAKALRLIARHGRAGFYEGPVAEDMVKSLNALGGVHTLEDFALVRGEQVEPVSREYRGTELIELPPNGQGATALLLAGILEGFDLSDLDPFGPERVHLEMEAARMAYEARNRLVADPSAPDAAERVARMLDPAMATAMRERIDPMAARYDLLDGLDDMIGPARALGGAPHRDTVYLSVADSDGMLVSLIYSVFHAFGSGLASAEYGITFQNRGAGFTLAPGHPNEYGAGKRPMHTIIPAMLARDGAPLGAMGVMGGQYQAVGHARVLGNMVDFGMDPQEALDAPRCFFEDGRLELEGGYARSVLDRLGGMGHSAFITEKPIGGGQIILVDRANGAYVAGSDPRKDGCAIGW